MGVLLRKRGEVLFQPVELVLAENAQAQFGLADRH